MKIKEMRKSLEPCTESGWDAVDVLLQEGLSEDDILKIGKIGGSFLYMKQLRKPFFKIESHEYVVKGVRGDLFFRVASHRDCMDDTLKKIKMLAEGGKQKQ